MRNRLLTKIKQGKLAESHKYTRNVNLYLVGMPFVMSEFKNEFLIRRFLLNRFKSADFAPGSKNPA